MQKLIQAPSLEDPNLEKLKEVSLNFNYFFIFPYLMRGWMGLPSSSSTPVSAVCNDTQANQDKEESSLSWRDKVQMSLRKCFSRFAFNSAEQE